MEQLQNVVNQGRHKAKAPMESSSNRKMSYRSDIDGLRAIAVLSVIAFHIAPEKFKGGFVGVDIFFVISGFLISSIIYKELESDAFSIVEFYVRRIRRIYPALFIVLSFVCVAGWIFLLPSDFVALGKQILGGSTFVANFVLWWQSGYFSPEAALKPLLHLWSLGVEEQYYLIFPLICIAFYRSRSRWTLPAAFLAIAAVSMFLNVACVSKYSAATYFLPFSRLWELFVGAGLSLFLQRNMQSPCESRLLPKWRHGIGFLGLVLLVVSVFGIDQFDAFPGWWALLPTIGAVLVIVAGQTSLVNRYVLSSKPAVFVGLISYPLYLWHWPILVFMRVSIADWGAKISHLQKGAMIIVAFFLAYLTYRFIELPIRHVKPREQRRKGALWLISCVSLIGAFGVLVILMEGFPTRLPSAVVALDHDYGQDGSISWRVGTCFLRPDQYAASFSDSCVDTAERGAARPLALVWGDSHAADLFPGFRALQDQSGVRLAQFTASSCPPIVGVQFREQPACLSINDAVLDRVRGLKPDIVVLSAYWDSLGSDRDRIARAEKLLQTIELVKAAGVKKVVVLGSAPVWTTPVKALLVSELHRNPGDPVPRRLARGLLVTHDDTLLKATTLRAGAVYVPVFENLCDQTSCIVTTGPGWKGMVTYDQSHFTDHGSMLVARSIWASIIDSKPMLGYVAGAFGDVIAEATTGTRAESRLPVVP
jgi:peptidoglycan/LPS O-acetylase OafA/YrhL